MFSVIECGTSMKNESKANTFSVLAVLSFFDFLFKYITRTIELEILFDNHWEKNKIQLQMETQYILKSNSKIIHFYNNSLKCFLTTEVLIRCFRETDKLEAWGSKNIPVQKKKKAVQKS